MSFKPVMCGGKPLYFPTICTESSRFVGIEDITIYQGTDFDLRAGVGAYDEDGNPIPFTVTPSEVDVCLVGKQEFVYEANGVEYTRVITVLQSSNPVISGLTTITVAPGEEFDPGDGVTAVDGNGNSIPVTWSGYPTIEGLDTVTVQAGAPFDTLEGVTATDGAGNTIPVYCEEGNPYTPAEGEHTLHYYAVDENGLRTDETRDIIAAYGHFEGIENTIVTQGTEVDLSEGITAYNYDGEEMPFTVTPEYEPCEIGDQTYTYSATGVPSVDRTITVTEIEDPVIDGVDTLIFASVGHTVSTLEGVTATDGNGNSIPVTCIEGETVTYSEVGEYTLHYRATDSCGNTTEGTNTVVVRENEAVVCDAVICESTVSCEGGEEEAVTCESNVCECVVACEE